MSIFSDVIGSISNAATSLWSGIITGNNATTSVSASPMNNNDMVSEFESAIPEAALAVSAPIIAASILPSLAVSAATPIVSNAVTQFFTNPITSIKTAASAVGAGAIAIAGTSAVVNSKKLQSDILKAPSALASFGSDIGTLYDNPSMSNLENVFSKNPIIATGVTVAGASMIGMGISNTVSTIMNTSAMKKNTAATLQATNSTPDTPNTLPAAGSQPLQSQEVNPVPAAATPTAGIVSKKKSTKKKSKKKSTKKKPTKKKSKKKAKTIKRSSHKKKK
jgi:hypothetical protein